MISPSSGKKYHYVFDVLGKGSFLPANYLHPFMFQALRITLPKEGAEIVIFSQNFAFGMSEKPFINHFNLCWLYIPLFVL